MGGGTEGLWLLQGRFLGEQRLRAVARGKKPGGESLWGSPCRPAPCCAALPQGSLPRRARWARGGERAVPQEPGDSPWQRFSPGWLQPCPGPQLCRSSAGSRFYPRGSPGAMCSGDVCSGKQEGFCPSPAALLPSGERQVPSPQEHTGVALVQPCKGSCPQEAWTIALFSSPLLPLCAWKLL